MEAYNGRADKALGYLDWESYVKDRFGTHLLRLPSSLRSEVASELHKAGMSTRGIASVVGVGKSTIERDLAAGPNGPAETVSWLAFVGPRRRKRCSVEACGCYRLAVTAAVTLRGFTRLRP